MLSLFRFEHFEGFAAEDFDAFEERKWASNRFNLERMKTRARLEALGRDVGAALAPDLQGLVFRTTLHNPDVFNRNCVRHCWLFLDRPEDEKSEMTPLIDRDIALKTQVQQSIPEQHFAISGVALDFAGAAVFFRLYSDALLDRRNLAARLADPVERQQFPAVLAQLPPGASLQLAGDDFPLPGTPDAAEAFRKRVEDYSGWLTLEYRFDRKDPLLAGAAFTAASVDLLRPLLAVWRFAAWSRTNDRLRIARTIKEEKRTRARKLSGFNPGDDVLISSGLLAGKRGTVEEVDDRGRVKIRIGRVSVDMDPKLLRNA